MGLVKGKDGAIALHRTNYHSASLYLVPAKHPFFTHPSFVIVPCNNYILHQKVTVNAPVYLIVTIIPISSRMQYLSILLLLLILYAFDYCNKCQFRVCQFFFILIRFWVATKQVLQYLYFLLFFYFLSCLTLEPQEDKGTVLENDETVAEKKLIRVDTIGNYLPIK